jgi:hypothetical protein
MTACDKCHKEISHGDWPFCPHGRTGSVAIIGDECDVWIENMGRHPLHFRSKSEHRREMKERGLKFTEHHVPRSDGGQSDTVAPGVDPYTMNNVKELMSRAFGQRSEAVDDAPTMIPDVHAMTKEEFKQYVPS